MQRYMLRERRSKEKKRKKRNSKSNVNVTFDVVVIRYNLWFAATF